MIARITHRQDIEAPHEPNHRLVKVRTTVLARQHGHATTMARAAFTKVERFCKRIAEASQQALEKEEQTVPDTETAPSPEDISSETPPEDDKPESGPVAAAPEDAASGIEGVEHTPVAQEDTTSEAQGVEHIPQKPEKKTPQGAEQAKEQDTDLPSCGQCKGFLTFPCWYCVKCEGQLSSDALRIVAEAFYPDDLFLCAACEAADVTPELMRSSGKHSEHHHLIRCQAPKKADEDETFLSEQRRMSLEDRLITLEDRLNNVHTRMDTIEELLRRLAEAPVRSSRT